uniref:Beta/gamma crystallin 'Greek key' domain-containing protein n=1 Tax=Leptobrachium leishanense TaxID=445787 RepID=A0A8C5MUZ2_9ANUR
MSGIELFSERDFKGDSVSLDADTADLRLAGFDNYTKSMRITGDPWVVFAEVSYKGEFKAYKEGDYASIPSFENKISSVRVVKGGLSDPEITVYEHVNYGGRAVTLKKNAEDLRTYGFDKMISSHKVSRGGWILYENTHYQGNKMLALAGDQVPNYVPLGWNDKVSSIKLISALAANE